jgi:hypothetical protein
VPELPAYTRTDLGRRLQVFLPSLPVVRWHGP